jgi:hypothetical protein
MMNILNPNQLDLLSAAFRKHDDAFDHFQRWNQKIDWSGPIDGDAMAVLPAIYQNLQSLGYEHPLFPRFAGIDRRNWVENQRIMNKTLEWLPESADTSPIALPPTAFLFQKGVRFPHDRIPIRLAVRIDNAKKIILDLQAKNFSPAPWRLTSNRWLDGFVRAIDHLPMRDGKTGSLSITWRLETWFGERANGVWHDAVELPVGLKRIRVLQPTDAMEFALRQPVRQHAMRWLTGVLCASSHPIDWQALQERLLASPLSDEQQQLIPHLEYVLQRSLVTSSRPRGSSATHRTAATTRRNPLRWANVAWRRFWDSWDPNVRWLHRVLQLPGDLYGRMQLAFRRDRIQIPISGPSSVSDPR